jgi:hypothetical protein
LRAAPTSPSPTSPTPTSLEGRANLTLANLTDADLTYADLTDANLTRADAKIARARITIVPDGDIVGWKKCNNGILVKMLIPASARRSNATGRKCRAEFAEVLEIIGGDAVTDQHGPRTEYRVGEIVQADKWDENRFNECSNGIHFFITREEAEAY